MVREPIDAEGIGTLFDGTAGKERRDALLTDLSTADEDYEVFIDTAAVLREIEEEKAGVIPLWPRLAKMSRQPGVRWLAAAAVLATVAIPVIRSRAGRGWGDPQHLVALIPRAGSPSPDWPHAWSVQRGLGGGEENAPLAARLGALHLDLVLATAAEPPDPAAASRLALDLAGELRRSGQDGVAYLVVRYQNMADSAWSWPRGVLREQAGAVGSSAAEATEPDYFALGAWTEAARFAAQQRNAAFFRTPESRRALERVAGLADLDPEALSAAERLSRLRDQAEAPNWTSVSADVDKLQQELAR